MHDLTSNVLVKRIKPDGSGWTVAAGQTNVNSDIVDMAGYNAARFIIGFGAITSGAVTSIKVQQNDVNSATGMADLAGTAITVADTDDNKIASSEIIHPQKRFLRLSTLRATQEAAIDFLIVELYGKVVPTLTQDANTTISAEVHQSPIEGTA